MKMLFNFCYQGAKRQTRTLVLPSLPPAEWGPGNELPSIKRRKVLFTYGGWNGHEPEKFRDYTVPWLKQEGAEVLVFDKLDPYADKAIMDTIDLVIQQFTMSQITKEQEKGL